MNLRRALAPLTVAALFGAWGSPASAAPAAPVPAAPASGSSLLEPFAISWSAVTDPNGIVAYNNPLPPPPAPLSPVNGPTLTLPITLKWSDVPNPQPSGYEVQIATDSRFRNIEEFDPQLNDPTRTVLSLRPGTKFWRARSM